MKVSNRITWIVVGLVCAYFAVVAGDAVHQWVMADTLLPKQGKIMLAILLSFCVVVCASFECCAIIETMGENVTRAVASAFLLTVSAFFFGEFSGAVTAHGPYPWQWYSGWSILLALGAVPMVFAIKDVASDIIAARRQVKEAKSNAAPLKREDRA